MRLGFGNGIEQNRGEIERPRGRREKESDVCVSVFDQKHGTHTNALTWFSLELQKNQSCGPTPMIQLEH